MAEMTKVVVCGCCGKMGSALVSAISCAEDLSVIAGIERHDHSLVGQRLRESEAFITVDLGKVLGFVDVVVDFTTPKASVGSVQMARDTGKAMVLGTTGFSEEEEEMIREASEKIPCLYSPNMSLGVNVLFELVPRATHLLGDGFDVQIVETHHRQKLDAPSGTAKRLAESVARGRGKGARGSSEQGGMPEIAIHSLRAGDIVGEHSILFAGKGETVELRHSVTNRSTFAEGAVRAIRFVAHAEPGLYDMLDVLGVRS